MFSNLIFIEAEEGRAIFPDSCSLAAKAEPPTKLLAAGAESALPRVSCKQKPASGSAGEGEAARINLCHQLCVPGNQVASGVGFPMQYMARDVAPKTTTFFSKATRFKRFW